MSYPTQHPFAERIRRLVQEARLPGSKRPELVTDLADLLEQVTLGYASRMEDNRAFGKIILRLTARYARYRLSVWRRLAVARALEGIVFKGDDADLKAVLEACKKAEAAREQYLTYEPVEEYDPENTRLCHEDDAAEHALSEAVIKVRLRFRKPE